MNNKKYIFGSIALLVVGAFAYFFTKKDDQTSNPEETEGGGYDGEVFATGEFAGIEAALATVEFQGQNWESWVDSNFLNVSSSNNKASDAIHVAKTIIMPNEEWMQNLRTFASYDGLQLIDFLPLALMRHAIKNCWIKPKNQAAENFDLGNTTSVKDMMQKYQDKCSSKWNR